MTKIDDALLRKISANLKVQAMMFDMDIDWETLSLVDKDDYKEPYWLTKWKEKERSGDRQPEDYEG